MSQLIAVSSPASGREVLQRAQMLRRTFFPPQRFAPVQKQRTKIRPVIVYSAPVEIQIPKSVDLDREAAQIAVVAGKRVRVVDVICATADHFKVGYADLISHRRSRSIARPRQVAMFLSKELTPRTLPEIGKLIGGRDHTTILYGCRLVASLIESGDGITSDVEAIRARLLA